MVKFNELKEEIAVDDISMEDYREYVFPGGDILRIEKPVALHVTGRGSHFVIDSESVAVYVSSKFIAIRWHNREGIPRIGFTDPTSRKGKS